jgi:hypothetical protein
MLNRFWFLGDPSAVPLYGQHQGGLFRYVIWMTGTFYVKKRRTLQLLTMCAEPSGRPLAPSSLGIARRCAFILSPERVYIQAWMATSVAAVCPAGPSVWVHGGSPLCRHPSPLWDIVIGDIEQVLYEWAALCLPPPHPPPACRSKSFVISKNWDPAQILLSLVCLRLCLLCCW